MKDILDTNTRCCPYCGGESAHTVIIERYTLVVDFNGSPYGQADNEIVSGGRRFICDACGKNVSKFMPKLEIITC